MVCIYEQRSAKRSKVTWPVSIWHPKAARFYNGLSIDVSRGGAFVMLPMKVPVQAGQELEVNFPRGEKLAQKKGGSARIKPAKVVRIDRSETISSAMVKVGLKFSEQYKLTSDPEEYTASD